MTLTCDEGGMLFSTWNLKNGNIVGAESRQVVKCFTCRHLRAETKLAISVRTPREDLSEVSGGRWDWCRFRNNLVWGAISGALLWGRRVLFHAQSLVALILLLWSSLRPLTRRSWFALLQLLLGILSRWLAEWSFIFCISLIAARSPIFASVRLWAAKRLIHAFWNI